MNIRQLSPASSSSPACMPLRRGVRLIVTCATLSLAAFGCQGQSGEADESGETGCEDGEPDARSWWEFGLADPILDEIALHYLGQVWHQSADVGEVLETLSRVDAEDPTSWTRAWRESAERLAEVAAASEAEGHAISAGDAYLRAATYYRAALHRHADPFAPEVAELTQLEVENFEKYLELSGSPCESITFPYEDTTLPGYFCRANADAPAPTLLFHEGRDGWAEDGKFIADAALRRGYNVLLFDGPGMGKVLRSQGLVFRPDWEAVISPAVDYVIAQPETDPERVGLIAVSMGGYLGTRAAAFEPRLKLLVVNPGVLRWNAIYEGFLANIDPELLTLLDADEDAFNATIEGIMQQSEMLRWGMVDSMWHHGVDTPAALMKELRNYQLDGEEQQISAEVLVVDAEAEVWGQSMELFEALPGPKDYLLFLASEAAQFHVQPGASGIAAHRLFDWIDDTI
jgi:pimeloyl-ACP methyl ester carboxylesterase